MSFDIKVLSEQENTFVKEAEAIYGIYYTSANERIKFMHSFISRKINDEATIFVSFLGSSISNLTMAFLSVLRRHENQANLMLRHVLESVVLSCYSLTHTDYNEFVKKEENGEYVDLPEVKHKANVWFEENYKTHSIKIKALKKMINERHSHSNLGNTFFNVLLDKDSKQTQLFFFDNRDINAVNGALMGFSFIVCDLIEVISKVVLDYPLVEIKPDFDEIFNRFAKGNSDLLNKYLKENP